MTKETVYGHAMIRKVDRHGEHQNHNQLCRHRRPWSFDVGVSRETGMSSESCDTMRRGR